MRWLLNRFLRRLPVLSASLIAGVLTVSVAEAQDVGSLQQRLDRLERDIRTLNKIVARGADAVAAETPQGVSVSSTGVQPLPQGAVARIGARLDQLEADLRAATGTVEEMNFRMDQLTKRIDKLVGDVDFRLTGLEQRLGVGAAAQPAGQSGEAAATGGSLGGQVPDQRAGTPAPNAGPVQVIGQGPKSLGTVEADSVQAVGTPGSGSVQTAAAAPSVPRPSPISAGAQPVAAPSTPAPQTITPQAPAGNLLPTGDPQTQYDFAFGLLRQHNLEQAELAFAEFAEKNEGHRLVANSVYWKGETYFARGQYVDAAKTFLEGYERFPDGSKAPDSLLKLGVSLGKLGETDQACGALAKLFADFPKLTTTLKRRAVAEQRTLGCQ